MKKICVIDRTNIKLHPPVLTLLDNLSEYDVTIVSSEYEKKIIQRYPNYRFWQVNEKLPSNKFYRMLAFRNRCRKAMKEQYEVVWVATADTGIWIGDLLKGKKYVLNIFELYDKHPIYLKLIKKVAKSATEIVVPEYNRAHIFRTWFELPKTPIVIPNKFSDKKLSRKMPLDGIDSNIPIEGKIIIYQGIASAERNLDALCRALDKLEDYKLVMMCSDSAYLRELMRKYNFIIHQPFVIPPSHLAITSYAHIGVVTYTHYSLNTIFCAPNKIWEYSSLGLPMLANSIPGLYNTVEKYHAGRCVNFNSEEEITTAIYEIERNYDKFAQGALALFDSVDVCKVYMDLLNSL